MRLCYAEDDEAHSFAMHRREARNVTLALAAFGVASAFTVAARAEPPSPELMTRLAASAASFEQLVRRAEYALDGRMEDVDGDGHPRSTTEMRARVEPDGDFPRMVIERYVEDGEDKTGKAQEDARERADKRRRDPDRAKKRLRMPTLADEQSRYSFDVVEVDRADASRIKLSFVPLVRDERAIEGTAWIDTRRAAVLSAGFKLVKTSMFVRYVHVTVVFGADTPLGPAVSRVDFEGEGGVLFLHKHFRGSATLSGYRLVR